MLNIIADHIISLYVVIVYILVEKWAELKIMLCL